MKNNFINRATSRLRNYFLSIKPLNYIPAKKAPKSYDIDIGSLDFATIVFENICDLLVDLVSDTTLILKSGNPTTFKAFSDFF